MRLHHLAFRTHQRDALVDFYTRVFALTVRATHPHATWLGLGDAVLMLEDAAPDEAPYPHQAREFVAFTLDTTLAEFEARCAALGVRIEAATAATRYLRDPDQRRVGVSTYRF
ncbi:MAG: hypothetical protein JNK72_23350 [Myxococcales bacterium]|nr:hypothetical protein [Myxococcales bacterium]